ncbi:MAG: hypothetical protein K0S61_3907, partial [Anaerocolumna sp.]|nr:hypothetical protein [Anaerocolumna sp.]
MDKKDINKKVNFFRDAKKNWMLYFMLIPTLIFFIVNNY